MRRPSPKTPDKPEKLCFPDYRGFPVLAEENEHRIWILQVEIHKLKEEIPFLQMTLK